MFAGLEPAQRVTGDVAASQRVAQDRSERRQRPGDRARRTTLGDEAADQVGDVVGGDRRDPPSSKRSKQV
ncbi:MAG TPA: hypothetical protein VF056_08905 [Thermoleophilaceae bacterium]